ncbi:ImmA/IrrE family metallo-endopeptidase [Cetobacterium sp.]|uniref:ImmA/IrrE family metallo-endopeptidase n=1 Tax=Cetobacterium sp. TaxID=2071632 RepID=UPI003F2D588F
MRKVDLYLNEIFELCSNLGVTELKDLCRNIGITIQSTEYISHSKIYEDNIVIYTNPIIEYDMYVSEKFQIAHELGHLFMHMLNTKVNGKNVDVDNTIYFNYGACWENNEANYFAKKILDYFKEQ